MSGSIAVIDCAIQNISHRCFNRLVERTGKSFTFHIAPKEGLDSIKRLNNPTGYIILGSMSNVCDKLTWQIELAKLMKDALDNDIPVLGICFGHQLMTDLFGGEVDLIDAENKVSYKGYRKFNITHDVMGLKSGDELAIATAHSYEIKSLPNSMICFGSSDECRFDAVAHKELPFFSVQGHPEASRYFLEVATGDHMPEEGNIIALQNGGDRILDQFINFAENYRK